MRISLLITTDDIETNPGPKKQSCLKFFHWDLSGLVTHDFTKLSLIETNITTNNFNIVCFSETFLNYLSISNNDNSFNITGNSLIRTGQPSNT